MKLRYVLLGLLLLSLAIRVHPPLSNDFPVNFDSIYHARIGQTVAETGWVPSWDYAAGGRPHLYPPLYHLTLGYGSIITGVPVLELIKYILPFISVLLILPVFFLIKKYRNMEAATLGAAVVALNPIITAQAYDSPQLFGLLLFPLLVYYFLKGKYFVGGGLFAVCILFNYFIAITIAVVFTVFSLLKFMKGDRMTIVYCTLIAAIGVGLASPWLLVSLSSAGECFDPSTAVSSITGAGIEYLLIIAPFVAFLGFSLLYWLRKRDDEYTLIWRVALALGTIGFLVSLFIPQLHPYDQFLLFGFSLVFIIPELRLEKKYIIIIMAILLVGSILAVLQVKPALSDDDLRATYWIRDNVESANILANPEISGVINTLTMSPSIRTEFDLFLECIPDSARWSESYGALMTTDVNQAKDSLEKYNIDYVIVGARDVWNYGFDIDKFDSLGEVVFKSGDTKIIKVK